MRKTAVLKMVRLRTSVKKSRSANNARITKSVKKTRSSYLKDEYNRYRNVKVVID